MLFIFKYLFSLVFPNPNEYLDEYNYSSGSESDLDLITSSDEEQDLTSPLNFLTHG